MEKCLINSQHYNAWAEFIQKGANPTCHIIKLKKSGIGSRNKKRIKCALINLTELDRYVPKALQVKGTLAIPLHPALQFEASRLTKENEELRTMLTELEARLEKLIATEAILNYLQQFKDQFTFHCIAEGHDVTILRCANILKMGLCSMKTVCKGRLALGKKLNYL